jgi:hypothetical protein
MKTVILKTHDTDQAETLSLLVLQMKLTYQSSSFTTARILLEQRVRVAIIQITKTTECSHRWQLTIHYYFQLSAALSSPDISSSSSKTRAVHDPRAHLKGHTFKFILLRFTKLSSCNFCYSSHILSIVLCLSTVSSSIQSHMCSVHSRLCND